ncbi:MAG: Hsp20 family protein [Steroidobacteraceae bacterium]
MRKDLDELGVATKDRRRRFSLPENVNADAVHCESKDGVLTVHIPKTAESPKHKAKQITVQ